MSNEVRYATKRQQRVLSRLERLHDLERELEAELRGVHGVMARYAIKGRDEGLSVRQLATASGRSKTWIGNVWTAAAREFDARMGPR